MTETFEAIKNWSLTAPTTVPQEINKENKENIIINVRRCQFPKQRNTNNKQKMLNSKYFLQGSTYTSLTNKSKNR